LQKPLQNTFKWFVLAWTFLNLVQAYFTELTSDEGYYWFYSTSLQWGYYDHPPMVALLIHAGTLLFKNEFGVRLFTVLMSTGSLMLFYQLLPDKTVFNKRSWLLYLSFPLITYLSFIVFPDGPLIFFSLLFLYLFKRFINTENLITAIWLGISMALMLYSKYHAVLVIGFTILANLYLLRRPLFYLAGIIGLLLFLPHLWWQYQHHFVTFGYHLSGRTDPWSTKHVLEYISQQIPAIGLGVFFIPFVWKSKDVMERTMKTIAIGTFIFFFISSFKTFVHFHWTSIALYPILYLAVHYYHNAHKKLFSFLIIPFVFLILIIRIQFMFPLLPFNHANVDYYHGRKLWAEDIHALAGDKPVIFANNLRETSLYSFYTHSFSTTIYGRAEKKSQYDLWNFEDSLQHKDVLYVALDSFSNSNRIDTRMGERMYYQTIPDFVSYYDNVPIKATISKVSDSSVFVNVILHNERKQVLPFTKNARGNYPALTYEIEKNQEAILSDTLQLLTEKDSFQPGESRQYNFTIPLHNLKKGHYDLFIGIRFSFIPEAVNSNKVDLKID
jgi:4-amino-4-deoxy-L-arabinose transferase and related glycosyltransferases of PMT family